MSIGERPWAAGAIVSCALLLSACASNDEQARAEAEQTTIEIVQSLADRLRGGTSTLPASTPAATVAERTHEKITPGENLELLATSSSGPVAAFTVMVKADSQSGGGLSYADYTARTCARLTIDPGSSGSVTASPETCPPLETTDWQGRVDGDAVWDDDYVAKQQSRETAAAD